MTILNGAAGMGLNPAGLLRALSRSGKTGDLKAQIGFRHRFAGEFQRVTEALKPRTMLILIDDLDRCRRKHVLDVLETINFFAASGHCFIVLGMARKRVEACIAEEFNANPEGASGLKTARDYLEKLINIEVPVPVPEAGQTRALLSDEQPVEAEPPLQARLLKQGLQWGRALQPYVIVGLILFAGFQFGAKNGENDVELQSSVQSETSGRAAAGAPSLGGGERQKPSEPASPEKKERQGATFKSGYEAPSKFSFAYWRAFLPGLFLLGVGGVILLKKRPEVVVQDSPEFAKALKIWHPWVIFKRQTPRSIKRFKNRVRYFAMRQRRDEAGKTLLEKGRAWLAERFGFSDGTASKQPADPVDIPESFLVALGAIHHCDPMWVADDILFARIASGSLDFVEETAAASAEIFKPLSDAIDRHISELGGHWPPTDVQRARFLEISRGIRIH